MGKLACRIELNKQNGITVTVENEEGGVTQTLVMDGEAITITCAGQEQVSTITQKPDSIGITCKTFTVDAECISCHSSGETILKSDKGLTVRSTGTMTFDSEADLIAKAATQTQVSGQAVKVAATEELNLTGATIEVSGKEETKVSGGKLHLTGVSLAKLHGGSLKISADGKLDLGGRLTTIQGSVTTVQGSLVKLG